MFALRAIALCAALLCASCSFQSSEPPSPPTKIILGGTLIDGTGRPPIPNSLVIVAKGKIVAAGAASDLKIPEGAVKTNSTGLFVTPSQMGGRLEFDAPADLFLVSANPIENPLVLGSPMRVMKAGEWSDDNRK
ncbi:hypothetical protein [Bryobacter aggregatus]|uniref:hypothetical protein n=1 Tax=Bryobacter aggregatus TaxID=360054 RepID=UPI0004E27F62|nr:hypothetical protein [Bryobacter aggregatus]